MITTCRNDCCISSNVLKWYVSVVQSVVSVDTPTSLHLNCISEKFSKKSNTSVQVWVSWIILWPMGTLYFSSLSISQVKLAANSDSERYTAMTNRITFPCDNIQLLIMHTLQGHTSLLCRWVNTPGRWVFMTPNELFLIILAFTCSYEWQLKVFLTALFSVSQTF